MALRVPLHATTGRSGVRSGPMRCDRRLKPVQGWKQSTIDFVVELAPAEAHSRPVKQESLDEIRAILSHRQGDGDSRGALDDSHRSRVADGRPAVQRTAA